MRMNKASLAITAAGIIMASAGLASALPAAASPALASRPAITTVIDTNFAGYVTGGNWRFRYVAAEVPTAACRSAANQNALAGIALKSSIFSEVAHLDLRCGGGHGSVMFGTAAAAEGHFQLPPTVGDVLRISIFRDTAARRDEFTATNTRTNNIKDGHGEHPVPGGLPARGTGRDPHRHFRYLVTAGHERPAVGIPGRRHHQLQRHPRHDLRPVAGGKAPGRAGDHGADDPIRPLGQLPQLQCPAEGNQLTA
jgi:hypothetical protein